MPFNSFDCSVDLNDTALVRDVLAIEELETLRALAEPTRVAMLEILAEPRSVREVAAALDVPRTRLYHHVELLLAAGLVEQVDERRSGALNERVYQVSARRFRVSKDLLTGGDVEDQLDAVTAFVFDASKSDFRRSILSGRATFDREVDLGRSVAHLTAEQAARFFAELEALVARFDEARDPGADTRPFALTWALHPSASAVS